MKATLIPRITATWHQVYRPEARVFPGPDGPSLRAGETYADWIPNDHTFVRGPDGRWHCFGITGPASPHLHEAEWQAFHISAVQPYGPWSEHDLVLAPAQRPGDRHELWAPFVIGHEGQYHMYYGPDRMGHAVSDDLFRWRMVEHAFEQGGMARDPWIYSVGDRFVMVYVAGDGLFARESADLWRWSPEPRLIYRMTRPGVPESPLVVPYAARWYLFWTICDGQNGMYDNRTFVFASDDPMDFQGAPLVGRISAHAPELFEDAGRWFVSSAEWPRRGVCIAPLAWEPSPVPG